MSIVNEQTRDTKTGRFLPVNGATLFERRGPSVLDPEFRGAHEEFKSAVIADLGGPSELSALTKSYVERLAEVNTVLNLLTADIAARGLLTARGRTRRSVDQWMKALDKFDRLAQRIGLDRRAKRVASITDYLSQPDPE